MREGEANDLIRNPQDLQYIYDVVASVLEKKHELGSISNFQSALKEASLLRGKEIQMNLVYEQNRLVGFNFSFANAPHKTTLTIPFGPSINAETPGCNLTNYQQTSTTIDVPASQIKGNIEHRSPGGELTLSPSLQAKNMRFVDGEINHESEHKIESHSDRAKLPANQKLINLAERLGQRQELDGLWLSGLALKSLAFAALPLEQQGNSQNLDIQSAGSAVIKRLSQVLPQHFADFKSGETLQSFKWRDPHSNQLYRFELASNKIQAFDLANQKAVFSATLIDAKHERWTIEQCDFSKKQLQSLSACYVPQKESIKQKSTEVFQEL